MGLAEELPETFAELFGIGVALDLDGDGFPDALLVVGQLLRQLALQRVDVLLQRRHHDGQGGILTISLHLIISEYQSTSHSIYNA